MISKLLVVAGSGAYPRMVIAGARRAGVVRIDVLSIKGSCDRATRRMADGVYPFAVGQSASATRWAGTMGYDGAVLAGQANPLSLFSSRFEPEVKKWLAALPTKNAHTIFGKLIEEFERYGTKILPASSFMDEHLPGLGPLTVRGFSETESSDIRRGIEVASDVGRHDVGQTVMVKSGMVLAVEAFEGTNAAIRRGGRLGGKGAVVFKAAREGHDMRFDIPVIGLKTLKVMKSAGVSALAFQAGRLLLLDRDEVIAYANRKAIAIRGLVTDLPPAPTRPSR